MWDMLSGAGERTGVGHGGSGYSRGHRIQLIFSIIIGLTLAVNDNFVILFVVIIFHRTSLSLLSLPFPSQRLKLLETEATQADAQKCSKASVSAPVSPSSNFPKGTHGPDMPLRPCTVSAHLSAWPPVWARSTVSTQTLLPLRLLRVFWTRFRLVSSCTLVSSCLSCATTSTSRRG